ncbi:MAG: hypothetical protein ABSG32_21990 [Terriglobia bacterium]|jgi:hypothetical protein
MVENDSLRQSMLVVFEHLKKHEIKLQMVMNEVAALKRTLEQASNGKFLPLLQQQRDAVAQETSALSGRAVADLEAMIQSL